MADLDTAHEDGFTGDVSVLLGDDAVTVHATLRGYFEPLDGRYHWYGRLAADDGLAALVGSGKASARVRTEHGDADCVLSDIDPWGRLRIAGVSTPPFPIVRSLEDLEPGPAPTPA